MIVITLLIDGDGCPVTETAVRLCNQYGIPCVIFCDTSHEFYREGVQTMVVDKGADSVDYAISTGFAEMTLSLPRIMVWHPCVWQRVAVCCIRTAGNIQLTILRRCFWFAMNPESTVLQGADGRE